MDRLFELGARDAWLTPILMKKGRPAHTLSILANPEDQQAIVDKLIEETSTLGVRVSQVMRHEAQRRVEEVETSLGPVRVKLKLRDGSPVSPRPRIRRLRCDCVQVGASSEGRLPRCDGRGFPTPHFALIKHPRFLAINP